MKNSQSGMALIAVLLFLILITIAGAIAVRQSSVDLKLATADQAGTLLLNTSDSVISHIEQAGVPGNSNYATMMSQKGVMGYFSTDTMSKIDHQIKFCYKPGEQNSASSMFILDRSTRLLPKGGVRGGETGICNPANANHYTSKRSTAVNQIMVRGVDGSGGDSDNFGAALEGEDNKVGKDNIVPRIEIHSMSMLPALSSVDAATIKSCLTLPGGSKPSLYNQQQNITACLKQNGVPTSALVEEASIVKDVKANNDACATNNTLCTTLGLNK